MAALMSKESLWSKEKHNVDFFSEQSMSLSYTDDDLIIKAEKLSQELPQQLLSGQEPWNSSSFGLDYFHAEIMKLQNYCLQTFTITQ